MDRRNEERSSAFREKADDQWELPVDAPLVVQSEAGLSVPRRRRRKWVLAAAALIATGLAVVVGAAIGSLGTTDVGHWDMQMTSTSKRSMVALVYGKEAGLHLLRVPGTSGGATPTRLPAKLGEAVYVVSLGRSPIEVSAVAPANHRPMSWSARGRVIKAFKDERGTGVRAW